MSPRWAEVGGAKLYFYTEEPHQRPHIDVVGPDWDVTIALDTLEELHRSGSPPRGDLRRVRALLRAHQDLAVYAFHETRQHRFPGTLAEMLEDDDD